MTNYFAPTEDLAFLLSEVLELERLRALPAFAALDADIVKSVLTEGARFSQDVLSPINAPGDRIGSRLIEGKVQYPPGFADAFARYAADGWLGMDLPESVGGQGLPRVLQAAFAEMTNGANLAFSMLPVTIRAAARLLLAHCDAAVVEKFVPAMVKGDCAATIVISEPQAGSDVGRIRTLALPKADGSYRLSGTKCFISNADNDFSPQIAHIVLARTPGAAAGTRGISLFLVPKYLDGSAQRQRNGVQVLRIEHKMGLNASPTCVLEFTDAHAFRIGSEGRGLNAMFVMVNTMRLEVAMQGVAIGSAAMSRAIRYSFERVQGGPADLPAQPIIRQPDVVRMLLTMRARTEALRALTLEAALQLDLSEHESDGERRRNALGFAQWLLPICKAYASDLGFETANAALQVFGGYGYIKETGVEQYVRDVRVAAIYEGTNGIQAIDLMMRKLIADRGERLAEYLARMRTDAQAAAGDYGLAAIRSAVMQSAVMLERVSNALLERATRGQLADLEVGAAAYLKLAGFAGCAWMWLRMASKARGDSALHEAKRATAQFFAGALMPEAELHAAQALVGDGIPVLSDEQWSAGV
jgi:alkylation response protein AidB-like acyl-CoA dehydrogenase